MAERAAEGLFDLMSLTFPADDPQELEEQGFCVTTELIRLYEERLSRAEQDLWTAMLRNAEVGPNPQVEASLWRKFNHLFIEQVAALGWRMCLSSLLLSRLARWSYYEWEGLERLEKFNAGISRYAEVKRGKARLPFTEQEWPQTRRNALREIKALQKRLSAQLGAGIEQPTVAKAAANASSVIRIEIDAKPTTYRYLFSNLLSFLDYLESHALGPVFVIGGISPGTVLNGWFDYQSCAAEDKSRQIISRIGSQKRR